MGTLRADARISLKRMLLPLTFPPRRRRFCPMPWRLPVATGRNSTLHM